MPKIKQWKQVNKFTIIKGDYFHTLKYTAVPGVDDINETASYNVLFSVLKILTKVTKTHQLIYVSTVSTEVPVPVLFFENLFLIYVLTLQTDKATKRDGFR